MLDSQKHCYILILYIYKIYIYSGRWYFADQLHVLALYIGHHQVGIINLIGNYTNVHG
jgi:hypothetical protein